MGMQRGLREDEVRTADVLKLTGASKPTLYRWMEKHPTLAQQNEHTLLGHPFPKPSGKQGREVIWDDDAVAAWWKENKNSVGRHPTGDATSTTMRWERFRAAMLKPPEVSEENGEEVIDDHMAGVLRFEREGEDVRLWFRDANDAVLFKLTYA